jgi:RecA/RadA recombinase
MAKKKPDPEQVTPEQLTQEINGRPVPQAALRPQDLLSTGSTLLNLALTGRRQGGYVKGKYVHVVGDSNAGKTWFAMCAFAEAAINPTFDDYQFIYNAPEGGAIMDKAAFFGSKTEERIEEIATPTVQELYYDLDERIKRGEPFLYVLDSESAISSVERAEKFSEELEAHEKGEEVSGSYGTDKPKYHSAHLNEIVLALKEVGAIMIWISQTRDNIGFGSQFKPKTYSGGHALKFYATHQIWVAIRQQLTTKFRGKDRQQGIVAQLRVAKNRVTGRNRVVEIPIYHSFGVDDVGSCVDWLVEEGRWRPDKKDKSVIIAHDLDVSLPRDELIAHIEKNNLEKQLQVATAEGWQEIEQAIRVDRKSRYV